MPITLHFCLSFPALALLCLLLRFQMLLPASLRKLGKKRSRRRYSVVTAVYNAERWLPDYFRSLFCQTLNVEECLEIICVDDGSTDASSQVIRLWQKRYPGVITYIRKENGGPASARNMGIERAAGEWVTFMDADDVVHPGYFAAVDAFIAAPAKNPPGLVICNYHDYIQSTGAYRHAHHLRYRFADGERRIPADDTGNFIHVVGSSAFFLRRVFLENGIRQKEDVRPTFEDGEMVIRYVLTIAGLGKGMDIGLLPQAKYYARKREGAPGDLSLTQRVYQSAAYFDAPLDLGCLRLLRKIRRDTGKIPLFAQMTVLHYISRYIQRVLNGNFAFAKLPETNKQRFFKLVYDIFAFIDPDVLENAVLPSAPPAFIPLMLGTYKDRDPISRTIYIERYAAKDHSVCVFFYSRRLREPPCFYLDGRPLAPKYAKTTVLSAWQQGTFYEHRYWLPLPRRERDIHIKSENAEFIVASTGRNLGSRASLDDVITQLSSSGLPPLPWHQALLVRAVTSWPVRRLYGRSWLFVEQKVRAGDNAEHLYRHVLRNHPKQRAYFVLRRDSRNWDRLTSDGFRIIPFGSKRHTILLLNCKIFIISRFEKAVTAFLRQDLIRCSFVFLGTIREDRAILSNKLPIAFQPMSTLREREYVTGAGSPFRLTEKEAKLTGLPRFDSLFPFRGQRPKARILFSAAWRRFPAQMLEADTNAIRAFLHDERLAALLKHHEYSLVFLLPSYLRQYFSDRKLPERVSLVKRKQDHCTHDLLCQSSIVMTNYSSIALDAAYLGRPLIYYQFNRRAPGGVDYRTPYGFDYKKNGFGPVTETLEHTLDALEGMLRSGGIRSAEYSRRAEEAFVHHDGENCERVCNAIEKL